MRSTLMAMMAAPQGSGGLGVLLIQIALFGAILYFLMIRPQSQARKKHATMLAALKKGDDITTSGGIIGKVKDLKEDRVTIESGTSTIVVERSRIVRVGNVASTVPNQA